MLFEGDNAVQKRHRLLLVDLAPPLAAPSLPWPRCLGADPECARPVPARPLAAAALLALPYEGRRAGTASGVSSTGRRDDSAGWRNFTHTVYLGENRPRSLNIEVLSAGAVLRHPEKAMTRMLVFIMALYWLIRSPDFYGCIIEVNTHHKH